VLKEMQTKLRGVGRETTFQKQDRLDKEFDALVMRSGQPRWEFQSFWEEKIGTDERCVYRYDHGPPAAEIFV